MIHTETGGWIVNEETRRKIPFKRDGNTYYMDAWVKLPDKDKSKDKDKMDVESAVRSWVSAGRAIHDLPV